MIKSKKAGKTLDEIGKRWHSFDFKSEKIIYCYLCCNRNGIKKKELQNLYDDLKFEEYQQWKQYICNKYRNYSKEKLFEFSKYLNLMIRNIKPSHEYWNIMTSALLSAVFTLIFTYAIEKYVEVSSESVWSMLLVAIIAAVFSIISLIRLIITMMHPIYDNHFDENFLRDYKEIIDEIVEGKIEKSKEYCFEKKERLTM